MDENELFEAWRNGDTSVEADLIASLRKHAIALCWTFLGEIPYEVVDMVVFQAIRFSHQFRGASKFSTWFHHVVQNACKSYLRKKIVRRKREVPLEEDVEVPVLDEPPIDVERAVDALSPFDQKVLKLKQAGHSQREIAERLAVTENVVNNHFDRLKKKIARRL